MTGKFPRTVIFPLPSSFPVHLSALHCSLEPLGSLCWAGKAANAPWISFMSLEHFWGQLGCREEAAPEEYWGPALSWSLLCPSSSSRWLHCSFSETGREVGTGPRTTAARETAQSLHGLLPHPTEQGALGLGCLGLPLCRLCVERHFHRYRVFHALDVWARWCCVQSPSTRAGPHRREKRSG